MVTPVTNLNWLSTINATPLPPIKDWGIAYSQNPAEIALDSLRSSLSDISLDELLEGLEETRLSVFKKFYGSVRSEN